MIRSGAGGSDDEREEGRPRGPEDEHAKDLLDRAAEVCATRLALTPGDGGADESAASTAGSDVTLADLARALLDPARGLSPEQWRKVARDSKLSASLRHLTAERMVLRLPRLAAASSGGVGERRFKGGVLSLVPSSHPGEVYVRIAWPAGAEPPRMLLIEREGSPPVLRALPERRASGEMLIICDRDREDDRAFLDLLADPLASGSFLA